MTTDELTAYVWQRLPERKRLVGRRAVARVVKDAVRNWPHAVLAQCDRKQADVVAKYYAKACERNEAREVGVGFFASIVLGAIVSRILELLMDWYLARNENRSTMADMTKAAS